MSKLREAALAALKELDYIEQTGDISTGSHIDVAQKLRDALAEDRLDEMQALTEIEYSKWGRK